MQMMGSDSLMGGTISDVDMHGSRENKENYVNLKIIDEDAVMLDVNVEDYDTFQ